MPKTMKLMAFVFATIACAPIEQQSSVKTSAMSVGDQLIAGKGDAVLTVESSESLPNAFGGADIFGRTRPTGMTTLFYMGTQGGKAQFNRRDVVVRSEKTTMNSSPVIINPSSQTSYSGRFGSIPYSGTANTQAYPIILPPNSPADQIAGIRDLTITAGVGETVVVAGRSLKIVSATPNQLSYALD